MTYEEVLKALDDCYFDIVTTDNFQDYIIDNIKEDIEWDEGASKVAIFFPNTDFVVKIPFAGYCDSYSYNEDYWDYTNASDDMELDEPNKDDYFCTFIGARDKADGSDYCKAEAVVYQRAVERGVDMVFAETKCIGTVHNYPIYVQPICQPLNKCHSTKNSKEDLANTRAKCEEKNFTLFNTEWQTDVLKYYGEAVFEAVCNFIQEERIDDLHSGNIGYKDGLPILFDYAGYED